MSEAKLELATITGAHLEYQQSGMGEPVVFIHGAVIADAFWPLLHLPRLTSSYRLILYHRRGYAGSGRPDGPISIAGQAADCRELLRHLGVQRAHVVGHSFGGAVALQLAADAPMSVHSLALIEPALMVGRSGPEYRESLVRGMERYRTAETEPLVEEFLEARTPGCRAMLDRILPGAFAQGVADAGTTFEVDVAGLLDWTFGETEAQRISQPTLSVLGGESDPLSPRFGETHQFLLTWIPNADGVVLPGTTHFPQLEDPQSTGEALAAFWSSIPISVDTAES